MSTVIRLSIAATLALSPLSCTTPADLAEVQQQLTGSFDWIESSGGFAGQQFTPASTGYAVRLEFAADRVRAYRDGALVGEARITVAEDRQRESPTPVYLVQYRPSLPVFPFAAFEEQYLHITGKYTVQLSDPCCDLYSHTFSKQGVR